MKQASFIPNPALISFMGLAPLIGATSDFAAGSVIGLVMACGAVAASAIGLVSRARVPARLATAVRLALTALFASFSWLLVETWSPAIAAKIGLYLPLLASSSFIMHEVFRSDVDGARRMKTAAWSALHYFSVAIILSTIREVGGAGTFTLPLPGYSMHPFMLLAQAPLPILLSPAGSFLALALLAVLDRLLASTAYAKGRSL